MTESLALLKRGELESTNKRQEFLV